MTSDGLIAQTPVIVTNKLMADLGIIKGEQTEIIPISRAQVEMITPAITPPSAGLKSVTFT